jgi:hypothetical protein
MSDKPKVGLKIMAYGRWCTGKTRQAASLIEAYGKENVYVVSCSAGLNTINGAYDPANVYECVSADDARAAWGELFGQGKGRIKPGSDAWVVLDGLTEACEWFESSALDRLDECARIVASQGKAAVPQHLKEWLRFVNSEGGPDQQKAYGPIGVDCKLFIDGWVIRGSQFANIYVTAHEQETQRDRVIGPPYMPSLPGKVAREYAMGKFDYVVRMVADNGGTAQLDPAKIALYWSRTRENRSVSGELPKEIPQFNLAEFVKRLDGVK